MMLATTKRFESLMNPLELKPPTGRQRVLRDATVLVVDDYEPNVALLTVLLREAGVKAVHGETDPREAVSRCLALMPDLVLLDLHMPHLDGYNVLAALRGALPADVFMPVLVLTADESRAARDKALEQGANDFLTKPFDHVETLLRVGNLLESAALHRAVKRHNARLQAELNERREIEQRAESARLERRIRIEAAIRDDAISMAFQPILDLRSGDLVGVEALARFEREPRRPPNEWFAEAADAGLGVELELEAVAAALRMSGQVPRGAFLSINVSAAATMRPELERLLPSANGSPIVLELTEHTRIEDYESLIDALARHRRQVIRIAIDDAGAGHAGLRHILRLRPDILKLDSDLARDIDADPARRVLAASLVAFADEIDAVVVAEGIETPAELETLQSLDVAWGQGYHLGRPGPLPAGPLQGRVTGQDLDDGLKR